MHHRYEPLTVRALALASRARNATKCRDQAEARRLARDCRAASGDERVVLAMTLTRYLLDAVPAGGLLHEDLEALEAAWEAASTVRRRAA